MASTTVVAKLLRLNLVDLEPGPPPETGGLAQCNVPATPAVNVPAHPEQVPIQEKPAAPPLTPTTTTTTTAMPIDLPKEVVTQPQPIRTPNTTTEPGSAAVAVPIAATLEAEAEKKRFLEAEAEKRRARAARWAIPLNETMITPVPALGAKATATTAANGTPKKANVNALAGQ
ncbi:hypothetical protein FRB95_014763 [Tulasnella sp. JGI-2019a]|nr:hypothetical protein FRB95_014763 [Tulasnella sp. JGI-2019a]